MMRCQSCGQVNANGSNFCRFCGVNFTRTPSNHHQTPSPRPQPRPQPKPKPYQSNNRVGYEYSPPKPYSWKTDELQLKEEKQTKPINKVRPLVSHPPQPTQKDMAMPNQANQQMSNYQNQQMSSYGYSCPRCSSHMLPITEKKISTAGWIVFAVLLVTFFPLFWIGFLMKEEVKTCPICNTRVGWK